ncbi:MAG: hypothetical protein FJ151_01540 [Euryarchaeota archaeon]|nr:hypothetical protein [Euryarchaeota archaeon]
MAGPKETKEKVKEEAKRVREALLSKETQDHLMRAGTEFLLALDSVIPQSRIPAEARKHYLEAKKEFLLMMKAIIDANLQMVEGVGKEEKPLKKIDVQ